MPARFSARPVQVAVREQFNPLGAGLRSIWPQSVVGF